jgi:FlaA1/EpsC-like NDP-sugar epimerase
VLGATKRVAEFLVLQAAHRNPVAANFVSVRFGNVLGSRGSVVPIFQEQIRQGGPITITHPDMKRYFMTIPESSQLALQAGLLGETGKVFVLDMGEPVRIIDLARDMVRLSGLTLEQDIDIVVSGVRPGEKLFEELFYNGRKQSQVHPKVYEGTADSPEDQRLLEGVEALAKAMHLPEGERQRRLLDLLVQLVPSYTPSRSALARAERRSLPRQARQDPPSTHLSGEAVN